MSRRSRRTSGKWFSQDLLPFLSIMLGLMTVMSLTTLGTSSDQRAQAKAQVMVQLAGIPDRFDPLQIRCKEESIEWMDVKGTWQPLSVQSLFMLLQSAKQERPVLTPDAFRFAKFLKDMAEENKTMSFQRKQHTLILWVEPTGVRTAMMLDFYVDAAGLPLRVGKLPALGTDRILPTSTPGAPAPASP